MAFLDQSELRARIEQLASIERGSASKGEAEAAEIIAADLRSSGAAVTVEHERAHGTYWWPIGILCGSAALAGAWRGRLASVVTGAFATAAVIDDISGGSQWFRRHALPNGTTTNVVAEVGAAGADHTVVVVAHHDAAHSGLVFHPDPPRALMRRFPNLAEGASTTPGTMWGSVAGPALVASGALVGSRWLRRLGVTFSAGYVGAMADIGLRSVVPGANDNLTGVGVLLSLGRSLQDEPIDGVRVILLSAGSEESFMEGMQAYGRRHFGELPTDTTTFICVDTVGSPNLLALEGEGMVWMNEYPKGLLATAATCARELGIHLLPGLRLRNATDGLIALRAGYPTITFGSVDEFKLPTNYHWPTDTADRVDYSTVADCARLCRRIVERLAPAAVG